MRTIYKYELTKTDVGHMSLVSIPKGAQFRLFDEQHREWCVWFEVDTDQEKEIRKFRVFATGETIPAGYRYMTSFNRSVPIAEGMRPQYFCWHLYEFGGAE